MMFQTQPQSKLRFEITFPAASHAQAITGRVYVMIARNADREPRLQIGRTGVPFFGHDIEQLNPGQVAVIDETDLGTPIASLRDLPAGEYYIQGFVNVYSEFKRADGHTVWMHDDQWEGQQFQISPGNLYSDVQRISIDPKAGGVIKLNARNVIPPIPFPADTQYVKRFRFQSPMLTRFWGRPIYLGATALVPRDYDRETLSYPVLYQQGHFSTAAPLGFRENTDIYKAWMSDNFPRMLVVTFQHPTPYFDDSYAVNSVNVGPYGDAIIQELIPEVEKRFRVIKEPYARVLSGGSTGGWESLALQIFHPDFFGGTWSDCPDPVEFSNVEGIDIYKDSNAFYKVFEWGRREPTVNTRETDGSIRLTSEQRNHFELASGTKGRSGQQLDIWSAVYGPLGKDGYFEPLFDKRGGEMNPTVAQYWKENYDLTYYLQKNWPALGPKLVDKIRIYIGTMDNFHLNEGVKKLQAFMKTTTNPHYEGTFVYGEGKGHCYSGPLATHERLKEMAEHILSKRPDHDTGQWWKH
jgi:putative esterase